MALDVTASVCCMAALGVFLLTDRKFGRLHDYSTQVNLIAFGILGLATIGDNITSPLDTNRSIDPAKALRIDLTASWVSWLTKRCLTSLWLGCGAGQSSRLPTRSLQRRTQWLGCSLATKRASQVYMQARLSLFVSRKSPWFLMYFLEDARLRGALRRFGVTYQFRHIRLQDRLAETHPLISTALAGKIEGVVRSRFKINFIIRVAGTEEINAEKERARSFGWYCRITPRGRWQYRDIRFDRFLDGSAKEF